MTALVDQLCDALATMPPDVAVRTCSAWLDRLSVLELAALAYDWDQTWARPNQVIPVDGWRSYGFLTARRFGKTVSIANFVNHEAEAGRAMRIGFAAQNEEKTFEVMVEGEAGLLETSPPWFKAHWERGRVMWPNGAQAFPFTPEVPGAIRGPGVHLFWASELQSWPQSTREEAWYNAQLMTSLGYARTVWDATPKRRHPLLRMLLARAAAEGDRHRVVRGSIRENEANLGEGVIEDLEASMEGTQRGEEELKGLYKDEAQGAVWKQEWIDNHRRAAPARLVQRIGSVDPAISTRASSDPTGIIDMGLGADGQVSVFRDLSERMAPEVWAPLVIDEYLDKRWAYVVAERNRGGDLVTSMLRAVAGARGISVVVREEKEAPSLRHVPNVINIVEVTARKSKESRAEPVAARYEIGKVSHVFGANLEKLEEEQTTWEPGDESGKRQASPNRMDALVHGVWVLAQLGEETKDNRAGFSGIEKARARLRQQQAPGVPSMLIRPGRGGRTL